MLTRIKGKTIRPITFVWYMALHGLVCMVKELNQTVSNMGELVIGIVSFWISWILPTFLFKTMNKMRGLVYYDLPFGFMKSCQSSYSNELM